MELCLIRHAIAVERDGNGDFVDDGLRPLTGAGRRKMVLGAAGLARVFEPDGVVSSPLVRARQTAEILQMAWGKRPLRFSEHLATGDHEALLAEVASYGWERVALVGREPHLSNLLSLLLSGSRSRVASDFRKGGAALVALPDGGEATAGDATLVAFLPPRMLRRMAKKG